MSEARGWGVGVEGSLGAQRVGELAVLAERLGYESFWFNVVGRSGDPVATLWEALAGTTTIEIGVGVFPLDAYPTSDIAPQLHAAGASTPRAIIGIASGQIREHVLEVTREALATLRGALPQARLATAGYGPRVLDLGGRSADVVLGSWLTPERLGWVLQQIEAGAEAGARPAPPLYLYHRAATGRDAETRLHQELAAYRRYPVHRKHQAEMGNPDVIGVAASDRGQIARQVAPYRPHCNIVLRPLTRVATDFQEWRSLLEFFAPS